MMFALSSYFAVWFSSILHNCSFCSMGDALLLDEIDYVIVVVALISLVAVIQMVGVVVELAVVSIVPLLC